MNLPASLQLYRWAMQLAGPLAGPILRQRARKGKEDLARLSERFGISDLARPEGALLWLHGASVGESLILLDIVKRLERETKWRFLVTSGTVTSADLLARELPKCALHQYLPLDRPSFVTRFLDHWKPDAGVFVESELWPNILIEARNRSLPLALINARMNEASLKSWARRKKSLAYLLEGFGWIGAADERTSTGLSQLAGRPIELIGNLKLQTELPTPDLKVLEEISQKTSHRFVWLAASTHEGEDKHLLDAHGAILQRHTNALLVLAPRHPSRGPAIAELIRSQGFSYACRSQQQIPDESQSVWLADTLGEMPLWYALTQCVFVGGSLIEGIGGHNPIEVTRAGGHVVTGPHTASFDDVYKAYEKAGGVIRAETPEQIAEAILRAEPTRAKALEALEKLSSGMMDTTLSAIRNLMGANP